MFASQAVKRHPAYDKRSKIGMLHGLAKCSKSDLIVFEQIIRDSRNFIPTFVFFG
jgi:hypothetical protein